LSTEDNRHSWTESEDHKRTENALKTGTVKYMPIYSGKWERQVAGSNELWFYFINTTTTTVHLTKVTVTKNKISIVTIQL